MPKGKQKKFECAAHMIIHYERWPDRDWTQDHQIGRCKHWKPHLKRHGACELGIECPDRGVRDYTIMQGKDVDKIEVVV